MSWEIRVWHEDSGERARVTIEADVDIPDDVISAVAGSYWFEQVQTSGEEWEDEDNNGPRLQG